MSPKAALKIYCLCLGLIVSFLSFLWISFQLYVLNETDSSQIDLMMARYLDICFGLLAFSSSVALLYGAFVESKTWLSVWTLGSFTVVIGAWAWYFYQKYGRDHPESLVTNRDVGLGLTASYIVAVAPVIVYYKYLESWNALAKACRICRPGAYSNLRFDSEGRITTKDDYRIPIRKEEDLHNPV